MNQAGVTVHDRPVVDAALERAEETGGPAAALQLHDGRMITGKTTDLLGASAALLLNALKELAGIDHDRHVISPEAIEPIQKLKTQYLGSRNPRLHTDEVLIALFCQRRHRPGGSESSGSDPQSQGLPGPYFRHGGICRSENSSKSCPYRPLLNQHMRKILYFKNQLGTCSF